MIVEFNLALIKRSFSSGVVGSVPYGCKAILLIVCVYTDTNKRNQSSNEKLEFFFYFTKAGAGAGPEILYRSKSPMGVSFAPLNSHFFQSLHDLHVWS